MSLARGHRRGVVSFKPAEFLGTRIVDAGELV